MPINSSNAVTLAHQVRTYTLEAAGFTDTVDVFYVAQMMDKFMDYLDHSREVSRVSWIFLQFLASDKYVLAEQLWPSLTKLQLFSFSVLLVFQLSEVLVEMGSNLMQVDDQILSLAQKEKRACSSIVCSLETLAWPQLHPNAQYLSMVGDSRGL